MPGYKYPNIDSGATPIGSAGRAPDRKTNIFDFMDSTFYSHRESGFGNSTILAIAFEVKDI
jgi:hypothetical protein